MAHEPTNKERFARIYEAMSGASAPGHHYEAPTGTAPESITAGHEPDRFDVRGIVAVPILIIAVTFLAYLLVTGAFRYLTPGKPELSPTMSPLATDESQKPFNERVNRISSTDYKAPVHQPRLEYLKDIENHRPGQQAPDPAFYRSFVASQKNNTYELKPQDLYPALFVDPATGERILDDYKKLPHAKARIPVDVAMELLLKSGTLKAKADGESPAGNAGAVKQSNGGAAISVPAVKAAAEKAPEKHGH